MFRNVSKTLIAIAAVAAVGGLTGGAATVEAVSSAAEKPVQLAANPAAAEAVKARVELMRDNSRRNRAIQAFIRNGEGTAEDVAQHAAALRDNAAKIPALFPEGSGRGDLDDKATRALPAIWSDWAGFEAASDAMESEAAKLADAAARGDKDAMSQSFAALGREGCGSCHDKFRGAKVE